jgi:glucose dehydrogenase
VRNILVFAWIASAAFAADNGWNAYGGDAAGTRYSPLKQLTRENVARLRPVWTYHTGTLKPETELNEKAAFEATPILVEGTLFLTTPFNRIIALDPASGAEKWTYDPNVDRSHDYSEVTSRGVAFWIDSKAANFRRHHRRTPDCRRRQNRQALRGLRYGRHRESDSRRGLRARVPRQLSGHLRAHRGRGSRHYRLFDCR